MGQGSKTQLLVGENLNYLIQRFRVNILLLFLQYKIIFQAYYYSLYIGPFFEKKFAFDFNGTYSLSLYRHL